MILAAGLTPAWQQIVLVEGLRLGEVNRADDVQTCASGKPVNVGVALRHLGGDGLTLVPLGGQTGATLKSDLERLDVPLAAVPAARSTRVCTTLVDHAAGLTTELVENSGPLTPSEVARFVEVYEEWAARAQLVVLSGSLAAETSSHFYAELLARTSCPVILDARGPELLAALEHRPLLVKPNREELGRTLGRDLGTDDSLEQAMREVAERGARWVVVSEGPRPLLALGPDQLLRYAPPAVVPVNPIGSGDSLAAGIAWALAQGISVPKAIRIGVAAAADNAAQLLPGRLDPDRVRRLATEVRILR